MRIISPGQKSDPKHKATCLGCGCYFEFLESEAKKDKDRDGLHVNIQCPECGTWVFKAL